MFHVEIAGGVASVAMDWPPVNAISDAWIADFHAVLDRLEGRTDWSVLHLRSVLKVFAAGADLAEMRARLEAPDGIAAQLQAVRGYQALFARIEALPRVTLAESAGRSWAAGLNWPSPATCALPRMTRSWACRNSVWGCCPARGEPSV